MECPLPATMQTERRQYRRLAIRLPVEYGPAGKDKGETVRAVSSNISTSWLYFEMDLVGGAPVPEVKSVLNVALTVPPGDGYFPYEGRVTGLAEVVRCDQLSTQRGDAPARLGIGARFRDPLKLAF